MPTVRDYILAVAGGDLGACRELVDIFREQNDPRWLAMTRLFGDAVANIQAAWEGVNTEDDWEWNRAVRECAAIARRLSLRLTSMLWAEYGLDVAMSQALLSRAPRPLADGPLDGPADTDLAMMADAMAMQEPGDAEGPEEDGGPGGAEDEVGEVNLALRAAARGEVSQ